MKIVLIIVFVFVVLFLQIGIFPNLKIFNVYPNIILLTILSLAVLKNWRKNIGWIIATGLFLDFYAFYNIVGISVMILLFTSLFAKFLNQKFLKYENWFSLIFIFLISLIFYDILSIVIFKIFGIESNFTILNLIIKLIYNAILALPVFYAVKWYVDRTKKI